jgi:hypothetical protein
MANNKAENSLFNKGYNWDKEILPLAQATNLLHRY